MTLKALTIRQPWASLIAEGVKTVETRSWSTRYRGRIAIHAGQALLPEGLKIGEWTAGTRRDLWRYVFDGEERRVEYLRPPLGAVVATAVLTDCVLMIDTLSPPADAAAWLYISGDPTRRNGSSLWLAGPTYREGFNMSDQLPFGDFAPGRFAWLLDDVKPTSDRCPACWGEMVIDDAQRPGHRRPCPICRIRDGHHDRPTGRCEPVPARGRQGLWNWEPAA